MADSRVGSATEHPIESVDAWAHALPLAIAIPVAFLTVSYGFRFSEHPSALLAFLAPVDVMAVAASVALALCTDDLLSVARRKSGKFGTVSDEAGRKVNVILIPGTDSISPQADVLVNVAAFQLVINWLLWLLMSVLLESWYHKYGNVMSLPMWRQCFYIAACVVAVWFLFANYRTVVARRVQI